MVAERSFPSSERLRNFGSQRNQQGADQVTRPFSGTPNPERIGSSDRNFAFQTPSTMAGTSQQSPAFTRPLRTFTRFSDASIPESPFPTRMWQQVPGSPNVFHMNPADFPPLPLVSQDQSLHATRTGPETRKFRFFDPATNFPLQIPQRIPSFSDRTSIVNTAGNTDAEVTPFPLSPVPFNPPLPPGNPPTPPPPMDSSPSLVDRLLDNSNYNYNNARNMVFNNNSRISNTQDQYAMSPQEIQINEDQENNNFIQSYNVQSSPDLPAQRPPLPLTEDQKRLKQQIKEKSDEVDRALSALNYVRRDNYDKYFGKDDFNSIYDIFKLQLQADNLYFLTEQEFIPIELRVNIPMQSNDIYKGHPELFEQDLGLYKKMVECEKKQLNKFHILLLHVFAETRAQQSFTQCTAL